MFFCSRVGFRIFASITFLLFANVSWGFVNGLDVNSLGEQSVTSSDFPSEGVVLQTGELKHLQRDLHIPGPNGLDIEIYRSYSSWRSKDEKVFSNSFGGEWYIGTPSIRAYRNYFSGVYADLSEYCLLTESFTISMNGKNFENTVGYSSIDLLPSELLTLNDQNQRVLTAGVVAFSDNSILDCRHYSLYLPDGRKVEFDGWNAYTGKIKHKDEDGTTVLTTDAYYSQYRVSKISDRLGNEIVYTPLCQDSCRL